MNGYLKQSTASQVRTIGPFVDDTDFKTLEDALTIANTDIKVKKNGAASANKNSGGATADGAAGLYHLTWNATDTDTVGEVSYSVKVAGALVVFGTYVVLEEAVYDALFAASAPGYGTAQTGDSFARLGAPAGASVSADLAAIEAQTDDIGTAGAGLTAVPWNAAWDAEVQSEVQDAIEVNHLDHLLAVTYDPASKPGVADALLNELVESDAGVARYTANALEQAPTGGSAPTVGQIADAVWDETLADHLGAGSTGTGLNAAGSAGDPWVTALPGAYGAGSAGKILGDNLNATVSSRASQASVDTIDDFLDTEVAAIKAKTDNLPSDPADQSLIIAATDAVMARLGAPAGASMSADIAAIEAQTDDIGAAGAGLTALGDARLANLDATISSRATPAQVNTEADTALADVGVTSTVTGRIDAAISTRATPAQVATELGTYDAPTKAELDAAVSPLALQTSVDTVEARLPAALVGGRIDASVGAMAADVLTASALNADAVTEIVAGVFARAYSAGYSSLTFDELTKLMAAALLAKNSGMGTATGTFRNLADSANTIVATQDVDGNRSAITLTP